MKKLNVLFLCLFATLSTQAMGDLPHTKVTVRVVDSETGLPISGAEVNTRFLVKDYWDRPDEYVEKNVLTDEEGICVLENEDLSPGQSGRVLLDGFYTSNFKAMCAGKSKVFNRWEPWNQKTEVKMRQIKNPVRMIYQQIFRKKIPVKEGRVGFDLQEADWVSPYGQGKESDFIFTLTTVTEPKQGLEYSITFTNPMDGIQEYTPAEEVNSTYIFPYNAPTNGYASMLTKYRLLKYPVLPDHPANNLKEDVSYIFRVRTAVDEGGKIISANYGRIQGEVVLSDTPLIDMQYWFNPDPQSRSLESDKEPY